jgi:hypothetical protein
MACHTRLGVHDADERAPHREVRVCAMLVRSLHGHGGDVRGLKGSGDLFGDSYSRPRRDPLVELGATRTSTASGSHRLDVLGPRGDKPPGWMGMTDSPWLGAGR